MLYADVELDADADLVVPLDVVERGMHVAHGAVRVDGQRFEPDQLAVFRPGAEVKIRALRRAGTPDAPGGRALGWPAPHLVELRILFQRADRSRQDRLARRPIPAGPGRISLHSAPRVLTHPHRRPGGKKIRACDRRSVNDT